METREKWIEVGPKGTMFGFFVAEQSFLNPSTGEMLPVPFSVGIISFVALQHQLQETDPSKIFFGMRVEAVFKPKEQRQANIGDIMYFKTIQQK